MRAAGILISCKFVVVLLPMPVCYSDLIKGHCFVNLADGWLFVARTESRELH